MINRDKKQRRKNMERTLQEMMEWNYKTAWNFFSKYALNRYIPETAMYIKSLPVTEAVDLRKNPQAQKLIMKIITPRTFILIDGGSCNGKTTLAKRIAKQTNAIIIDIDLLCKEWIENQIKMVKNQMEIIAMLRNMDKLTDEYLLNNLEAIIRKNSKSGRPVILVGLYLGVIYRSIIARTLGKYFDNLVSLMCCEESLEQFERLYQFRKKEFKQELPNEREKCLQQYAIAQRLIQDANGLFLGFGYNYSFIVNSTVSDMFKKT